MHLGYRRARRLNGPNARDRTASAGYGPDVTDRQAPDEGLTLPSGPQSVAAARRYAVETCRAGGYRGDCDTLVLLVSEVATNALIHGAGQVRVRVLNHGPRLRVEVSDNSEAMPAVRALERDTEGGRGLALVNALAAAWGAEPEPGGPPQRRPRARPR